MNALRIILTIVHLLICIGMIAVVLLQSGRQAGLGSIGGGAETFFGKNKGRTIDAMLGKFTAIGAVAFLVTSVALYLIINNVS